MPGFVSAIVLAAGMSKRMGTIKQLIKVGDRTLLETTLAAVQESAIRETILVLGHEAETIAKTLKQDPAPKLIVNTSYPEGMSSSIRAGLNAVSPESSAAMIVLADQPLLSAAVINRMIHEYESLHAAIVLPVYRGFRGNPVLIDRSLFPEMMQISGDIGCRSIFGLHPEKIHKVQVEDIGILVDIDTADDLTKLSNVFTLNDLQVEDRSIQDVQKRRLVIVGNEEVAFALAKLGKLLKFHVTVIDPLLTRENLPEADFILNELDLQKARVTENTFIVIASRGRFDEEALEQALNTPAKYVALVGKRKRGAELLQRLRSGGVSEPALSRVRCPAGLEIRASSPEEIALSVLAEIISLNS